MNREQLDGFEKWFAGYVENFFGDDARTNAHLELKQHHTAKVYDETRYLIDRLGLTADQAMIAETVALFHDVGRFEQFARHGTFMDVKSENHCLLALEVLREHKILDKLDPDEKRIIETAIKFHGMKILPNNLKDDEILFAKLIRDADKIDIYRVVLQNYKEYKKKPEGFLLEVAFPDDPGYSPEMADAVLNRRYINYHDLKTINDVKLMQLGWVFDINFPPSLERIKQRGYLDELIELLPDDETIRRTKKLVFDYVDEKIRG